MAGRWSLAISKIKDVRLALVINTIVFIGLSLLGGGQAWGAVSQTASTEVTMNIAAAIEVVSWPDAAVLLTGAAVPGQAVVSNALRFTGRCNSTWGIHGKSDDASGTVREFNVATSQYVADGKTSQRGLEWGPAAAGPWVTLSSTSALFTTNQPATTEAGATASLYLRYLPGFNDTPLGADRAYRIVLTYTAAVGY